MRFVAALALVLVLTGVGCVDSGPGAQPKKIEPAFIDAHLLHEVPVDVQHVDVTLGDGQIVYVGSIVDHAAVAPGGPVKITHIWRVLKPVGPGWRVFSLLRGAPGSADFMNLPITDMEIGHGPATRRAARSSRTRRTWCCGRIGARRPRRCRSG